MKLSSNVPYTVSQQFIPIFYLHPKSPTKRTASRRFSITPPNNDMRNISEVFSLSTLLSKSDVQYSQLCKLKDVLGFTCFELGAKPVQLIEQKAQSLEPFNETSSLNNFISFYKISNVLIVCVIGGENRDY